MVTKKSADVDPLVTHNPTKWSAIHHLKSVVSAKSLSDLLPLVRHSVLHLHNTSDISLDSFRSKKKKLWQFFFLYRLLLCKDEVQLLECF